MEALLASFVLGFATAASPCLLPLYPAFVAFLAARQAQRPGVPALLGLAIVLGVVTAISIAGIAVTALATSLSGVLSVIVPLSTAALVVLGLLLLTGRDPFARLAAIRVPVLDQPLAQAYVYGLFFGPVALPCAGPFLVALLAISLGVAETTARLLGFTAFGIGLGAPLVALSMLGAIRGRTVAMALARHHGALMRLSGILLIATAFAEPLRLALTGR